MRVIAHTKDDQSIRGVLKDTYRDCIAIDAPEYLVKDGEPERLKGLAVVLKDNLAWLQVLDAGT